MYQSSVSLSTILGGISKVLGIANQAIPLYKEIKPMAGNIRKVIDIVKEFNTPTSNKTTINTIAKEKEVIPPVISNKPTFFLN